MTAPEQAPLNPPLNIAEALEQLYKLAEEYHYRDGIKCYHYSNMMVVPWDSTLKRHLTPEQWAALKIEDWVVRIIWYDNSHTYDYYYVPLNDLLDWDVQRKKLPA